MPAPGSASTSNENECNPCTGTCPSTEPETPVITTNPPDPSLAGVNKESEPTRRVPGPNQPLPEGVTVEIEAWMYALVGSPQNSLVNQHTGQEEIHVSTSALEAYGAGGLDKLNIAILAALAKAPFVANIAYAVAWDPGKWPNKPLVAQANLPSAPVVRWEERTEYLPDYPYMRSKGEHDLMISVQLRSIYSTGKFRPATSFADWTEFPHIGPIVTKRIKVFIED